MRNSSRSKILTVIFLFCCFSNIKVRAQQAWDEDSIHFFRLTVAVGAGKGYPQQTKAVGVGVTMELTYQLKNQLFSFGVNSVSDGKSTEDKTDISNSAAAAFITYGRAYTRKRFFASLNTGVGFVYTEEKGKPICQCGYLYEKIKGNAVGLAVSLKVLRVNTYAGKGLEFFMNLNNKASFGGVNLCFQFGKLKYQPARKNCYRADQTI